MCLAIPAKVAALEEGNLATVDILGVTREISVDLTPRRRWATTCSCTPASPIEVVDADYAKETIELVKQLEDVAVMSALEDAADIDFSAFKDPSSRAAH